VKLMKDIYFENWKIIKEIETFNLLIFPWTLIILNVLQAVGCLRFLFTTSSLKWVSETIIINYALKRLMDS
jgi:hypothetical protein